jgi:hypothetical protein
VSDPPEAPNLAIDSNILTYFLDALSGTYDPDLDPNPTIARERVAAFRLFLYGPKLYIVPAVKKEAERIRHVDKRETHLRWIYYSLGEVLESWYEEDDVKARQQKYLGFHKGEMDCRAVAEAEAGGMDAFLTYDHQLLKALAGRTEKISLKRPSEYWNDLAIPPGTPPTLSPHTTNPLAKASWWRW